MNCPQCRSRLVMKTLMSWDGCHDPNRKQCLKCGAAWLPECRTCGVERRDLHGEKFITQEELEVLLEALKA